MFFVAGIAQGGYFEALYLPDVRYTELGFTEFAQTLVLASCCGLLIYVRQVLKVWPTVTLLLLAFVAASLVREQDYFFGVSGLSGWYARAKGGRQTQPTTD